MTNTIQKSACQSAAVSQVSWKSARQSAAVSQVSWKSASQSAAVSHVSWKSASQSAAVSQVSWKSAGQSAAMTNKIQKFARQNPALPQWYAASWPGWEPWGTWARWRRRSWRPPAGSSHPGWRSDQTSQRSRTQQEHSCNKFVGKGNSLCNFLEKSNDSLVFWKKVTIYVQH